MGWVAECFELAVSASHWSRNKDMAPKISKKLRKAALEFFEPKPDISAARKIVAIATDIGYAGPELDAVQASLELVPAPAKKGTKRVGPKKTKAGRKSAAGKKAARKKAARKSTSGRGASTRPVVP